MSKISSTGSKRPLEPTVSLEFANDEAEVSPTSDEPRKKGGKPSRRPLDSEAKNKRTAQNRAAQRAFRERKERKMKELEDKVHALEEMNQQSLLETAFLRSQLVTLVSELRKYRPEDHADSQVLEYLAKTENAKSSGPVTQTRQGAADAKELEESVRQKMSFTFAFPWKSEFRNEDKNVSSSNTSEPPSDLVLQFPSPKSSSKPSSVSTTSSLPKRKNGLSTPGSTDSNVISSGGNLGGSSSSNNNNNNNNGSFTPGSSSTGWMDNVFYSDDAQQLPQFYQSSNNDGSNGSSSNNNKLLEDNTSVPFGYDSVKFSNQFNFDDHFDEQVSEFCAKLGQACGTKECPVPKQKTVSSTPLALNTPLVLSNTWGSPSEDQDGKAATPAGPAGPATATTIATSNDLRPAALPFIDASLAFPEEEDLFRDVQPDNLFAEFIEDEPEDDSDPLTTYKTVNEEPQEPQRSQLQRTDEQPAQPQRQTPQDRQGDELSPCEVVVRSRDGELLKCNEVWDRITAHPKYTDMDIDGLCLELMAKAKCSEKGVVVQAEDVQRALASRLE